MSKNSKKEPEPDMIEMKDLTLKDDSPQEPLIRENNLSYPSMSPQKPIPAQKAPLPAQKPLPVQKQLPPANLYKPQQPSAIRMNGMVIPIAGQNSPAVRPQPVTTGHPSGQAQRTKVPQMTVTCKWCTLQQVVAGNSHIFVCCVCNNMNECKPMYNVFICFGCHTQVCYQLGVSTMIRCSKCKTVNKVPITVAQNSPPQVNRPQQQKPLPDNTSKLVEKQRIETLEKEEEINIQKAISISLRDSPSKKQFVEEAEYPDLFDEQTWQQQDKKVLLPPDNLRQNNNKS